MIYTVTLTIQGFETANVGDEQNTQFQTQPLALSVTRENLDGEEALTDFVANQMLQFHVDADVEVEVEDKPKRKRRGYGTPTCGACGEKGHIRRWCKAGVVNADELPGNGHDAPL